MGLELISLTKNFSGFNLGPLNLKIDNEIMVLIGPTGSGKTTILNLIAGMTKPDQGSVMLDGSNITALPVESRKIGYVFQSPNLFPHLTVYENIVFGLPRKYRRNNSHVKKLLEDLAISHLADRNVNGLSGGEMQKVSLARMLAIEPKIILLDEPLAHLDPPTRRKLRLELRSILKKEGVPAIYVTHFEDDVYALADSVAVLHNGMIENASKLETLLGSETSPFISDISAGANYIEGKVVKSKDGVTVIDVNSDLIETLGEYSLGSRVGILVRPEDIIISKELVKTSARNVVRAQVVDLAQGSGMVDLHLQSNSLHLRARVTEEARKDLGIDEGESVYAVFKATSPQVVREESCI
ncbi:MAG: ABC transporter ATP-binding protein [Nitrososphaerales archaeon]